MTGVPWEEVKSWLDENSVRYNIVNDATLPVPYVDLKMPQIFGEDKVARLYTEPGSRVDSGNSNILPFTQVEVVEAAMELGLDARELPSIGAGGQTMIDAVLQARGELPSVVSEEESYATAEDPTSEELEQEQRDQEEENELAEKIFEESGE